MFVFAQSGTFLSFHADVADLDAGVDGRAGTLGVVFDVGLEDDATSAVRAARRSAFTPAVARPSAFDPRSLCASIRESLARDRAKGLLMSFE